MIREPLYDVPRNLNATPELAQLVVPRLASPRTVCCSTCPSRTAPSKTYPALPMMTHRRGAINIAAGVMDRNRSGRRLSSCSDCRAKRSKCSHQISPAEDQGMPLAPEHALRSPPAHRTSAAFAVGFSPPLCQTQAMQPPHNQTCAL